MEDFPPDLLKPAKNPGIHQRAFLDDVVVGVRVIFDHLHKDFPCPDPRVDPLLPKGNELGDLGV
jgi:hypothetical protein